jgi:hypothetical protein
LLITHITPIDDFDFPNLFFILIDSSIDISEDSINNYNLVNKLKDEGIFINNYKRSDPSTELLLEFYRQLNEEDNID